MKSSHHGILDRTRRHRDFSFTTPALRRDNSRSVARFHENISSLQWDALTFGEGPSAHSFTFPHPAFDPALDRLNSLIRNATSLDALR